jgi:tellurite methyltransferase
VQPTAHEYWDEAWQDPVRREAWEQPDPWVMALVGEWRGLGLKNVVDLGCGVGRHTLPLAGSGFRVLATDLSPTAVGAVTAATRDTDLDVTVVRSEFTAIPAGDAECDGVLAFNVVYHGDESTLRMALAEVHRVLRPGGRYACTMLSKRNRHHGQGVRIATDTWVQASAADDKRHPHLFSDAADLIRRHDCFELLGCQDRAASPGDHHWYCEFERA